jgi:hypothetical protein
LLSPVSPVTGPADAVEYKRWGRAWAPDQPLRRGCHPVRFRYRIDPPTSDWVAEIFMVGPTGRRLAWVMKWDDFHPAAGRDRFEICRCNTRFGVHKMRMRITWYENDPEATPHEGWVRPTRFRLYRPR